jgi:hypothetical protein
MAGAFAPQVQGLGTEDPMAWLEKLYGPVTPRSQAGLMPETASLTSLEEDPRVTELRQPGAAEGAFGIMGDMAMQPVRAGEAVGEAIFDPSLENVTNAGVQSALAVGKPYAAAGSMGLGMLEGLRRDLGATLTDPAFAGAKLTRRQQREMEMKRQEEDARAAADLKRIEAQGKANAQLEADKMRIEAEGKEKASKREEYDRAVARAEEVKAKELSRDRRFSETSMGEVYEKTGGAAPFIAAMGAGGLHRLMKAGSGTFMDKYVAPSIEGSLAAFGANMLPTYYNMRWTEPDNPEKRAFAAYSRELPEGHPRKKEYADLADKLPKVNPIRDAASDDWEKNKWTTIGQSALEGPTGIIGANMVRAGARAMGSKAPDVTLGSKAPEAASAKAPGRVGRWLDKVMGNSPAPAASASSPQAALPAPEAAKPAKVKKKWNEGAQRYQGAHGHFLPSKPKK